MGITVVISHYAPSDEEEKIRGLLLQTIRCIRSQHVDFNVEIIICDDGSLWSSVLGRDENTIVDLSKEEMIEYDFLDEIDAERYLYINSGKKYYRSRLLHYAYSNAKYSKIVALDDDHQFTNKKALTKYYHYLEKYDFVRGRIIASNGLPQIYSLRSVQGTNQGFTKELYKNIGGLGSYLFEGLSGADDDLTYKIYSYLSTKYKNEFKACYAGEIITYDNPGSRWISNSFGQSVDSIAVAQERKDEINSIFNERFFMEYGVKPVGHSFRDKKTWMELPSTASKLSEIYYYFIYQLKYFPNRITRLKTRAGKFINFTRTKEGRDILLKRFTNIFL